MNVNYNSCVMNTVKVEILKTDSDKYQIKDKKNKKI